MFQPQPTPFNSFHSPPPSFGADTSSSSYTYFSCAAAPLSPGAHHGQVPPAAAGGNGVCSGIVPELSTLGYPSSQRHNQPPSTTFAVGRGLTINSAPAAAAAASSFAPPSNHHAAQRLFGAPPQQTQPFHPQLRSQPQYHHHQGRPSPPGIAGLKMEPDSDIAQQEAAARAYQPQLEGALVGDKTTSQAITAEYAKADPTYVTKTIALAQTYSHYRPIQGDGNCGWRAIGFSYFEQLIRRRDEGQIQSELNRLTGFNDFIEKVGGHDRWLFEDMVSESLELLQDILTCVSQGQDAMVTLMQKINDREASAAIVYHLRLLASSWLKGNPADFEPYLDTDITTYIDGTVLPTDVEIDHVCVKVLVDVLLKPANIVLEIAYLDRSNGDKVNIHRMPDEANGQDPMALGPMIHLLYRPGHYDILYNEAALPSQALPIGPNDLQVNRATSFTQHQQIQGTMPLQDYMSMNMSTLAMIPGFDSPGISMLAPQTSSVAISGVYSPSPVSWATPTYGDSLADTGPTPLQQQDLGFPQQHSAKPMTIHPLRFSKYNFPGLPQMNEDSPTQEPTFTTSLFKNSHFNTAHYSNNNFQPEMYSPESEDVPKPKVGPRKKST